jgi:hypothetical protein
VFEYAGKGIKLLNKRMQVYIPTRGWIDMIPEAIQSTNSVQLESNEEQQMIEDALAEINKYKRIIERRIAGLQNYYDHLTDNIQPLDRGRINELRSLSDRVRESLGDLANMPSKENSYPYNR